MERTLRAPELASFADSGFSGAMRFLGCDFFGPVSSQLAWQERHETDEERSVSCKCVLANVSMLDRTLSNCLTNYLLASFRELVLGWLDGW